MYGVFVYYSGSNADFKMQLRPQGFSLKMGGAGKLVFEERGETK